MEKLKELLKGIGASEELTNAFCEELERYTNALKEKFEKEYWQKIERAKAVCIEEVNKEKAALARRVKTFLESKAAAMEQAAANKRAIEESESAARLKKVKALLEGISIDDSGVTSQKLQDEQKKNARLEKALAAMREERNLAVAKANTANEIAAKALQRNRKLEEELARMKAITEGYCKEHNLPFPANGKCAKCVNPDDSQKKEEGGGTKVVVRLDESRRVPAAVNSTRRTMVESQVRSGSAGPGQPVTEIQRIAESIND
ncbi:MAG: hypothetical protein QXU32_00765 [Nitrososphaerales archaeon]